MSTWKLFKLSKRKEDVTTEIGMTTEQFGESEKKPEIPVTREEIPIKIYSETLYSNDFVQKKPATTLPEKKQHFNRLSWESLGTIEYNVDDMECKQTEVIGSRTQTRNDIDQKVDRILSKKKIR